MEVVSNVFLDCEYQGRDSAIGTWPCGSTKGPGERGLHQVCIGVAGKAASATGTNYGDAAGNKSVRCIFLLAVRFSFFLSCSEVTPCYVFVSDHGNSMLKVCLSGQRDYTQPSLIRAPPSRRLPVTRIRP